MRSSPQLDLTRYVKNSTGPGGLPVVQCPRCRRLGLRKRDGANAMATFVHKGAFDIIAGQRILRVTDSCRAHWTAPEVAA